MFPNAKGTVLDDGNVRRRAFDPAARAAGCEWASFHTLRHTAATLLFAQGRNIRQVAAWLRHADPSFTLKTYVGLLNSDLGGALDLGAALDRPRPAELLEVA